MKKLLLFTFVLYGFLLQSQTLNAGLRIQKTNEMYWENGISVQYSFKDFKPQRFYLGFDFVTSRLGTAYNSNAIKQNSYIASASWHGKEWGVLPGMRFVTRLNIGYLVADMEEEFFNEIPNTAFLFSPEIGFAYNFKKLPIGLYLGSGYYINFAPEGESPGTFQPLYYHLDIYYRIFKNQ